MAKRTSQRAGNSGRAAAKVDTYRCKSADLIRGTGFQPVNHRQDGDATAQAQDAPAAFDPRFVEIREGAYLPHWRQDGAAYAVTFRLADSMPQEILAAWVRERDEIVRRAVEANRPLSAEELRRLHELHSERVEKCLDAGHGACYMNDPRVTQVVRDALLHFDGRRYALAAWCVMPNHVHAMVWPRPGHELSAILHSWKSFTANQANRILGRTGAFWQKESYDHLLRDAEDFDRAMCYILGNPQQANLKDWPWVACGSGFQPMDPRA